MAAAAPPAAPPSPARTTFQFVDGDGPTLREAVWTVVHDSPLITALPFLPWAKPAAPARATVSRSSMVSAILMATRPPLEGQRAALRAMSFLTHEMGVDAGSAVLHEYDKVAAFNTTYATADAWSAATPGLWATMADAEVIRVDSNWFYETHNYRTRGSVIPNEMAFLHSVDLARLAFAVPSDASDPSCMAFARATTLAASKATSEERTDEASLLFQLAERVKALLLRALTMAAHDRGERF